MQESSAWSYRDIPRGMGTRWGRPLQGTLTMPGTLSTLMEGGICSIAPGEVVLSMILSPNSPSGKELSSMLIHKPTTKAEGKLMGLPHQTVTQVPQQDPKPWARLSGLPIQGMEYIPVGRQQPWAASHIIAKCELVLLITYPVYATQRGTWFIASGCLHTFKQQAVPPSFFRSPWLQGVVQIPWFYPKAQHVPWK